MIEESCYGSSLRSLEFRLSTTLLLFFLIFTVQTVHAEDFDQDGIDDANDLCLSTDLNGPIPTGILCDGCMGDDQTILGCNASDILVCKPGPNDHQFEMGINQRIQDTFSAQKGWAAKCGCDDNSDTDGDGFLNCVDQCPSDGEKSLAGLCGCGISETDSDEDGTPDCVDLCPNNPGSTVPDEYGYCASETQAITAGEATLLALDGAMLSIPPDTLEAGMTVTIAEVAPELLDTPPNNTGESLITPVYVLAFSAAQPANGKLAFTLDITTPKTTGLYARLKIEGGLATEGQSESDWLMVLGKYDTQQSQLTIEIGATATRFLVAGISTGTVVPSITAASSQTDEVIDPEPMVTQSLAVAAVVPVPYTIPEWSSHGWAVLCDPHEFAKFGLSSCDPSSPDFDLIMNDLGPHLYDSDKKLTSLGFLSGDVAFFSAIDIENSDDHYVIYDPDNRSGTTSSVTGEEITYFVAWVDPNTTDNARGRYDPSTKFLYVDLFEADDTVIHELMHAVQYIEIRNAWGQHWLVEALAAATEPFAPTTPVPGGSQFRWLDLWRDWGVPLASEDGTNEYEASELWLSMDEMLSLIPNFYSNLRGKSKLTDVNSYMLADEAMTDTGLPSLRDGYTDLILSRDSDINYPHCESVIYDCTGANCDLDADVSPISATCFDMDVSFCPDVPQDIKVTLESEVNPHIKLIVDGVVHEANTPVPFSGKGRIWAMNTNYVPDLVPPPPMAKLVFENETSCHLALRQQDLHVDVGGRADIGCSLCSILASPEQERIWYKYRSFEDLSEASYVELLHTLNHFEVEHSITPTQPLGLEPFSVSFNTTVEWQGEPPSTTHSIVTAQASVDSDTDGDATSVTTKGQLQTMATSTHDDNIRATGQGHAAGVYYYETLDVPAELNLTWDCTLSGVIVYILNSQTGEREETLLSADRRFNTFECGTRNWIIPANKKIRVSYASAYYSNNGTPEYGEYGQDIGGHYEIVLRAIAP